MPHIIISGCGFCTNPLHNVLRSEILLGIALPVIKIMSNNNNE